MNRIRVSSDGAHCPLCHRRLGWILFGENTGRDTGYRIVSLSAGWRWRESPEQPGRKTWKKAKKGRDRVGIGPRVTLVADDMAVLGRLNAVGLNDIVICSNPACAAELEPPTSRLLPTP